MSILSVTRHPWFIPLPQHRERSEHYPITLGRIHLPPFDSMLTGAARLKARRGGHDARDGIREGNR